MKKKISESSNSNKEIVETFSKADGHEHLPLVKRTRVRLGKSSVEETQLNKFVEKKDKLELAASLGESDTCIKSSSPANSPADETSLRDKETSVLIQLLLYNHNPNTTLNTIV